MEIEMLQEKRLRYWCGRLEIPKGAVDALVDVTREILADPNLLDIFTAFYNKTTVNGEWAQEGENLPFDPFVEERLEKRASLFYLLGYLAALPKAEREYRRLGISLDIFHDTMLDFTIWINHAYDLRGYWSFDEFSWLSLHVACKIFRIGRLQYALSEFRGNVTAFRHRITGSILLLGDPSIPLRADGYAQGAGGKPAGEEESWHAVFEETPAGWRGNRINPEGFTLREESFLLHSVWERILKHGDTVLDLHIPRGEKLTVKECRESLQAAYQFFPDIFPDRPFKGLYCHTWFFTPQLQQILPPESNIVRFQREFYLYPYPGGPGFLWTFVFGEKYPDATTAPRDTSLRRAVLDWMADGKELFDLPGLMLHSPDLWGTQPYYNIPKSEPEPSQVAIFPPMESRPAYPSLEEYDEDLDEEEQDYVLTEYSEIEITTTEDETDDFDEETNKESDDESIG